MGRKRTGTKQLRSGVWYARITIPGTKERPWYCLETGDEGLADRRLERLNQRLGAGAPTPAPGELAAAVPEEKRAWGTFREYAESWVAERKADGIVSARDEERNLVGYVFPTLGSKPLAECAIAPTDVKEVLSLAAAAGLAVETQRKIRGVMDRVFKAAIAAGRLTDNPVAKLPRRARAGKKAAATAVKKRRTILTDAEIARYLACETVDTELQLMSLVARVEGGMRTGDLNRWDWTHIATTDFASCVVPRAKTDAPQVLEVPEVLRGRLRARWEAAGRPTSGPVFPSRRGPSKGGFRAARGISFAARLRRDLEKAGVTRHEVHHETATTLRADFHSFRRAFNTALAVAGVNVQVAMRLAGHKDERTHMRYVMDAPELRRIPAAVIPVLDIVTARDDSIARSSKIRRATQDSNLRPSAPEGDAAHQDAPQTGARTPGERRDLGGLVAALIRIAAQESSHIVLVEPDPVLALQALIDRRGAEARAHGRAIARRVLADALGLQQVALAIEVLEGGPHADRRLVDLCELLLEQEKAHERRSA